MHPFHMSLASQMIVSAYLSECCPALAGHHSAMPFTILRIVFLHLVLLRQRWRGLQTCIGMFHITLTTGFLSSVEPEMVPFHLFFSPLFNLDTYTKWTNEKNES